MKTILQPNYKVLIVGILIGFLISQGYNTIVLLLDITLLLIYFIALLYFFSFTLIELLIYHNKDESTLKLLEVKTDNDLRCLTLTMENEYLLTGEELFNGIYNTIMSNEEFKSFGFQKIIILSCVLNDYKEFNLHSNVLIDNDTTFVDYYSEISNDLTNYNNLEYGYHNLNIVRYVIKAWNCDNLNNLNIKITHNSITMERQSNSSSSNSNKLNQAKITSYSVTNQSRQNSTLPTYLMILMI